MRSDWSQGVVDLTNDSDDDDDDGPLLSLPVATGPTRVSIPLPASNRISYMPTPPTRPTVSHVPLPGSVPRNPSLVANVSSIDKQTPKNGIALPTSSRRSSPSTSAANMGHKSAVARNYIPMPGSTQNSENGLGSSERGAKRMRVSASRGQIPPLQSLQHPAQGSANANTTNGQSANGEGSQRLGPKAMQAQTKPELSCAMNMVDKPNRMNVASSVQYMNSALKTNGSVVSLAKDLPAGTPRPLEIGRIPQGSPSTGPISYGSSTSFGSPTTIPHAKPQRHEEIHAHGELERPKYHPVARNYARPDNPKSMEVTTQAPPRKHSSKLATNPAAVTREPFTSRPGYFSRSFASPRDDETDSIMSDVSEPQRAPNRGATNHQPFSSLKSTPAPTLAAEPSKRSPGRPKQTIQIPLEQDHYLIFLKEVKEYSWKQVTKEFNVDFPSRKYSALQSRYSKDLSRRDRSKDPAVLSLPRRFASEAAVDWETVHARFPGPKQQLYYLNQDTVPVQQPLYQNYAAMRPFPIRQTTDQDYSSGADSAPRRERSSRAKRVNYTWPRNRRGGTGLEEVDDGEAIFEDLVDVDSPTRSETPAEEAVPLPDTAVAVDNEPMDMDYDADDAKFALKSSTQNLPYLTSLQRSAIQETPVDWSWDQLASRRWQGSVLHVDFSPEELEAVKEGVTKVTRSAQISRHSTRRRQMRAVLADLTEPKLLQLVAELGRRLPSRDKSSIAAFLQDAKTGRVADAPQIQRLAAARPQDNMSTAHKMSTSVMLRQRELGQHSRRGWHTASRPLTYQVKNKYLDTLGPALSWTGASSDVHTVAWSPDGDCFAAGAVAVDDPDSMQYNRPNNLLYGDTSDGLIHELGEHSRKREKTQSGANSTHAMFVSQDPKLYSTVSSVAFASSGDLMYSAGYDETVCVWHTNTESGQPISGAKIRFKAQIDMMAVNRNHDGVLATAAKVTDSKAIRLLTFDEEDPSTFKKHNFHSSKAVSRSDLNILPSALQFEPRVGGLLLAGFGANVRDRGFDMTGDVCLWDVETQTQLHIHGSNRNVFDIEFNSNRSYMPLFAVGCVAGPNVNRGTRSVLRLYDEKVDKFWCPLEIECKALDMNDVVWCPHDEHLIAAGCTDGRAYVWDLRWSSDPLRVLSHGRSLMPLQDGVPHEVTDTGIRFLSWGENATRLCSGSSDGVVKVWDVTRSEENTFIKDLITVDSGIMSGAFSPDMSKLVLGEVDGSVTVLEVGRDDCSIKDTENMRFVPYNDEPDEDSVTGEPVAAAKADSGVAEGDYLLQTGQVQFAPLGGLPVRQVVQGLHYAGPFDSSVDAPFLRQQALEFQLSMATKPGPQCNITACKDSIAKVTSEEIGDSGRSADRIPDEVRRHWTALDSHGGIIPGKSKCTHCSRPARPSATSDSTALVLCERCSFACFRCGATNPIAAATTTLICDSCAGVWDIGALGYECIRQPEIVGAVADVPSLKKFGKQACLERLEDVDTAFGDEMNALTDYYHSLAIDRPESPPL